MAAIGGSRDPAAERRAKRVQGMTFAELWGHWQRRKWSSLRPKSREGFASCWRTHIEPALGKVAVNRTTRADLQRLIDKVAGSKPATARKLKGVVHMLLAEGVRLDVVAANAAAGVEAPAYVPRARIVLSHEREPLLAAIDATAEPWPNFFKLLLLTGCRVSNLCTMAWADVDLDGAVWRIPAGRSKSKRTTALPLVPDAVDILRRRLAQRTSEWVFPSNHSRSGHVSSCREPWSQVLEHAGIEGLTRHDLRRSLATMMAAMGTGDRIIAAALGHTSLSAVKVYTHLAGEIARDAVVQAAAALTARKP